MTLKTNMRVLWRLSCTMYICKVKSNEFMFVVNGVRSHTLHVAVMYACEALEGQRPRYNGPFYGDFMITSDNISFVSIDLFSAV